MEDLGSLQCESTKEFSMSLTHPPTHSFVRSFIRSVIHSFMHSFIYQVVIASVEEASLKVQGENNEK